MSLKSGVMAASVICRNNSLHRQYISKVLDGVKMPSNVEKWQTWGLVTAYKVMLEDVATCRDCRQTMWEQARAWGITDLIIERMAHVENLQDMENN
jgi:hypothetical protein